MENIKKIITAKLMSKIDIGRWDKIISSIPLLNIGYKLALQKNINYAFPNYIFIEPTSACNLRCQMCPRNKGNTLIGNMKMNDFKKIIDESKKYGPKSFSLHLFGEPLLATNIIEMIKYIKESDPNNTILLTSNGTLLDEEKAGALIKYQVDKINLSFTSPDRQTYLNKVGVDKLEEVEKNIKQLVELKKSAKSKKPLVFVRLIVDKETKPRAKFFMDKWKRQGVTPEIRLMHSYGGYIQGSLMKKNKKRYPCYHLWLAPAIHWNGDVSICCDDYERKAVLGNIKNQTINEIWTGEKIKQYRKLHLQEKYDPNLQRLRCLGYLFRFIFQISKTII